MVVVVRLRASAERRSVLGGVLWRFCVSRDVTERGEEKDKHTAKREEEENSLGQRSNDDREDNSRGRCQSSAQHKLSIELKQSVLK